MAFFWRRKKDEDKFSISTLGLDKSMEELKAQEEAVEREIGVRFTRAIEKHGIRLTTNSTRFLKTANRLTKHF